MHKCRLYVVSDKYGLTYLRRNHLTQVSIMRPHGIVLNGTLIKQQRVGLKMTQADLAARLFASERHLQRIESGQPTSDSMARRLATVLEVSIEQLKELKREDLWFISEGDIEGVISNFPNHFWREFDVFIEGHCCAESDALELKIRDARSCKTIEVWHQLSLIKCWKLRPVVYAKTGTQWVTLRGINQLFWQSDLHRLSYTYVSKVTVDNSPLSPDGAQWSYAVGFAIRSQQSLIKKLGE